MSEVLMIPDWRGGNPYLDHLAQALHDEGNRIYFDDYPRGLFRFTRLLRRHPKVDILHIHWLAPMLSDFAWNRHPVNLRLQLKMLFFIADLLLLRLRQVRIVWTVHNLLEHETPDPDVETKIRAILFRFAGAIIVHSEGAKQELCRFLGTSNSSKISVIPHGHYLKDYPLYRDRIATLQKRHQISDNTLVILFFGALRPYKGLEQLIAAFRAVPRPDIRLMIAGKPHNEEIEAYVKSEASKDSRIRFELTFIEKDDVAPYFALSDVVAIPFQRTLTSGSVILAMGFSKCLILPEDARVLGIPDDDGAYFYNSMPVLEDILNNLSQSVLSARGCVNRKYTETLSWKDIAKKTSCAYDKKRPRKPYKFATSKNNKIYPC